EHLQCKRAVGCPNGTEPVALTQEAQQLQQSFIIVHKQYLLHGASRIYSVGAWEQVDWRQYGVRIAGVESNSVYKMSWLQFARSAPCWDQLEQSLIHVIAEAAINVASNETTTRPMSVATLYTLVHLARLVLFDEQRAQRLECGDHC